MIYAQNPGHIDWQNMVYTWMLHFQLHAILPAEKGTEMARTRHSADITFDIRAVFIPDAGFALCKDEWITLYQDEGITFCLGDGYEIWQRDLFFC